MSRIVTQRGFNVATNQVGSEWFPQKVETTITPTNSTPSWGSMFTINYTEQDVLVQDMTLQFNLPALTATTSTHFVPTYFWCRVEFIQSGKVHVTHYPVEQLISNNAWYEDEDRVYYNIASGPYQSTTARIAQASAPNQYYLHLRSIFDCGEPIPILDHSHNIQLRVYMSNLADVVAPAGTGLSCPITSVNLLTKIVRLRKNEADQKRNEIAKRPYHIKFAEPRSMLITIPSGVLSTDVVLNAINGRIAYLMFVCRPSNALVNNSCYQFSPIASFGILDSAGQNISGGQLISNSQACLILNRNYTVSTYTSENALSYLTDNKVNVYMYSFCESPADFMNYGISSGYHKFTGTERLQLNFQSTLSSNMQVDVFAFNEAVLEISRNSTERRDFSL
jgi:hypothetical protein